MNKEDLDFVCQQIKYLAKLWPKYKPIFDKTIEALKEEGPLTPVLCNFCGKTSVTFKKGITEHYSFAECTQCGARSADTSVHSLLFDSPNTRQYAEEIVIAQWNKGHHLGVIEMRISWDIDMRTGKSLWYPRAKCGESLKQIVAEGNAKYGIGTHWTEEKEFVTRWDK